MTETINQRIKRIRKERKLSQKYVAQRLDIAQSTYSSWEKNGNVTAKRALKLAVIFNVTPEELFLGSEVFEPKEKSEVEKVLDYDAFVPSKNEQNLIKILREFPKKDMDAVIKFIDGKKAEIKKRKK